MALSRTGLRSGELLALQWGDLNFDKREIRIERALHDGQTPPPGDRYVLGPVKGGRSRTIAFDLTCGALLRSGDPSSWRCPGAPSGYPGCDRHPYAPNGTTEQLNPTETFPA